MRWPVADPDGKRTCGHRRCARSILAAAILLCAGGAMVSAAATYAIARPDGAAWPGPAAIAGFLVGLAGGAAACWPHPREWLDDAHWMAIVNATREHPIWPDWDTRELTDRKTT